MYRTGAKRMRKPTRFTYDETKLMLAVMRWASERGSTGPAVTRIIEKLESRLTETPEE